MLQTQVPIRGSVHLIHRASVIRSPRVARLHLTCVPVIRPAATGVSAIMDTPATDLPAHLAGRKLENVIDTPNSGFGHHEKAYSRKCPLTCFTIYNVHCVPKKTWRYICDHNSGKNAFDFYNFCTAVSRKKRYKHT